MATACYLAMTPGEVSVCPQLPEKMAWMACHFSSSGPGISNLPDKLPGNAILILDDSMPFNGHDPAAITTELSQAVERLGVQSVLLDFQRPNSPQVQELAETLTATLPCPVGVSEAYAQSLGCPVFLPPLPINQCLQEYLSPYKGREIWLDMAPGCGEIRISPQGSQYYSLPTGAFSPGPHRNDILCCRYSTAVTDDSVTFSLSRGREELEMILAAAEKLGVAVALGLYQEWSSQNISSLF